MPHTYYVEWRIEIAADSPHDAAKRALSIQRDPESLATCFHVTRRTNNWDPPKDSPNVKRINLAWDDND